jgi:hypothetical protein
MLGSMGIKDGVILYHIGYGTTLGCLTISGVRGCCWPRCWLTDVGWVTKFNYDWICGTCTPTCIIGVLIVTDGRKVMSSSLINCLSLSSTKGQFLNSCPTCWQNAQVDAISTMGCGVVTSILC